MDLINKADALLSIEIGGTKLQLIAYSVRAKPLKRWRYNIDKDKGAIGIREQIETCLNEAKQEFIILETGIGFGGPVDSFTGIIGISHQIEGWSGFPLTAWVSGKTQTPCYIENDANTAALGEAAYGAGRGYRTVFYVTIGSGIGGGLVQDGKLYHGRQQGESEIGHLRMGMDGSTLESLCAGWAIDSQMREAANKNPDSTLASLLPTEEGGETRYLLAALTQECGVANEILETLVTRLSFGLSHVVHLFNPDVLILGGGVSLIGEPLRKGIENELPRFVMQALHPIPKVAIAELGEDVVPMGALAMTLFKKN